MIKQLRKRFIRIAMLAVTAVMLALCLIVNIANYLSVDAGLTQMLEIIGSNQGTMPAIPHGGKPGGKPEKAFTPETPFSTRYFVLRYSGEGTLLQADLRNIAAVTEEDTEQYLQTALRTARALAGRRDTGTMWCAAAKTAGWRSFWTATMKSAR